MILDKNRINELFKTGQEQYRRTTERSIAHLRRGLDFLCELELPQFMKEELAEFRGRDRTLSMEREASHFSYWSDFLGKELPRLLMERLEFEAGNACLEKSSPRRITVPLADWSSDNNYGVHATLSPAAPAFLVEGACTDLEPAAMMTLEILRQMGIEAEFVSTEDKMPDGSYGVAKVRLSLELHAQTYQLGGLMIDLRQDNSSARQQGGE